MKSLTYNGDVMLGCDPEFFFSGSGNTTIGAEKILPESGIVYEPYTAKHDGDYTALKDCKSKIVIDGVQAELNPRPNLCRANLANEISACFRNLHKSLLEKSEKVNVNFTPLVKISKKELDSLSEKSKTFGCAPSTNFYQQTESKITVNPSKYLKRSAGGHIHLGWQSSLATQKSIEKALKNVDVMIPILDIIVGNTCVLIDRNSSNKERRKVYGRVGEYRIKEYGLEYRTLSNFWLKSYQLMSFVMGMARLSVHIVAQSTEENNYAEKIMSLVNKEDIIKAINENDFILAYSNFLKIQQFLIEICGDSEYHMMLFPLNKDNINNFHHFVKMGVDYWFKKDSFTHWITLPEGHGEGWESFLKTIVEKDSLLQKTKKIIENINKINQNTTNGLNKKIKLIKKLKPSSNKNTLTVKVEKEKIEVKTLDEII